MSFANERKISVNLEKTARVVNGALALALLAALGAAWQFGSQWAAVMAGALLLMNILNFYYLYIQTQHALLANFGVLALVRYLIESIGPEFRQYLYSSDSEERPFSRVERANVYKIAKNIEKSSAFGSLLNFDGKSFKLKHSFYPIDIQQVKPFRVCFGEDSAKSSYTINKLVMISAMSYGALGKKAVRACARGAKKAGIAMNTGEGGYPKYHLMEGLI